MTIFSKAKLAIAFLSATLGHLVLIILVNNGQHLYGSVSVGLGAMFAFYAALSIVFERTGTYLTYLLCLALGVALFALTVLQF
jgi:hypothetical protein